MELTTLCYIRRGDSYLMLHRTENGDINKDKWIGVGGHIEQGESPEQCVLREIDEETGLRVSKLKLRGFITFCSEGFHEGMLLFTADYTGGKIKFCDEGELEWVPVDDVCTLPIWEGDRIFLQRLKEPGFFTLKLDYNGDELLQYTMNNY